MMQAGAAIDSFWARPVDCLTSDEIHSYESIPNDEENYDWLREPWVFEKSG